LVVGQEELDNEPVLDIVRWDRLLEGGEDWVLWRRDVVAAASWAIMLEMQEFEKTNEK
jgi:hypothetical protein